MTTRIGFSAVSLYNNCVVQLNLTQAGTRDSQGGDSRNKNCEEAVHEKNRELFGPGLGINLDVITLVELPDPFHNGRHARLVEDK